MASHSFDIDLASKYGVNAALLICHMQYWISHNKRLKRNLKDGRTWTYQTMEEIAAHFPYLGLDCLRNALHFLTTGCHVKSKKKVIEPILMKGNYNKTKFDRTVWYAFVSENDFISNISNDEVNSQIEKTKIPNQRSENPETIPDAIPEARTYSKTPTPPPTPPKSKQEKPKEKLVGGVGSLQELEQEFGSYILGLAQSEYKIAYDKSVLRGRPIKNQVKYFRTICERLNNQTLDELVLPEQKMDYEKNYNSALNGEKAYMSGKTILGYSLEARENCVRFILPDKYEDISYNMNHLLFMKKCRPYLNKLWP